MEQYLESNLPTNFPHMTAMDMFTALPAPISISNVTTSQARSAGSHVFASMPNSNTFLQDLCSCASCWSRVKVWSPVSMRVLNAVNPSMRVGNAQRHRGKTPCNNIDKRKKSSNHIRQAQGLRYLGYVQLNVHMNKIKRWRSSMKNIKQ